MKYSVLFILVIAIVFVFVSPVTAQDADPAQRALKYAEAQQKNIDTLKTYSWKTRTEISENENPMLTTLIQARFDADGKLQHTTISSESHVEKKRGIKGKKQKQKLEELGQLIEKVVSLQVSYISMSKGQMVDFFEKATFEEGTGEMEGMKKIHAKGVLVPNDELTVWVDPSTGLKRKLTIKTPLDEETIVDGSIYCNAIKDGPTTASLSVLTIPSQGISIKIESFDFIKQL
jgi:hypothetical protein